MRTIHFFGFAHTDNGVVLAEVSITTDGDAPNHQYLRVPIVLKPGQEPTEGNLVECIKASITQVLKYRQPYQAFEDTHRGKEIEW